jgi:hypothetical protein
MPANLDIFKTDTFHYTIASLFPHINYIEYYRGNTTSSNPDAKKSIVYFVDEVTHNFSTIENKIRLNYYTNTQVTNKTIKDEILDFFAVKERYFYNKKIDPLGYSILQGSDWPSYQDYSTTNEWKNNVSNKIVEEIESFEQELVKIEIEATYKNTITYELEYLKKTENFINTLDQNTTVIVVSQKVIYNFFISRGFKCIFLNVGHDIIGDCLSLKNILENFNDYNKKDFAYHCFNSRFATHREKTIAALFENNLLDFGLVTQNATPFKTDDLKTKYKQVSYNNDRFYESRVLDGGNWKNHNNLGERYYSNQVKNLIYINNNIGSLSNLVTETAICEWYVTEKSFQPLFCKKIPIIIGAKGINKFLINEGFDLFEDLVDYSFDSIEDEDLKINSVISCNKNLLQQYSCNSSIKQRLEYNRQHYLTTWVNKKIETLVNQLSELLE